MAHQRVRILLYRPGEHEPAANVWANRQSGEPPTFLLLRAYPDLKPEPGWELEAAGERFEVHTAAGTPYVLACVQLPKESV